jgi:hypothetical protein
MVHLTLLCACLLQVVELKGNIRVLARIRPLLEKERVSSDGSAAVLPVQASSAETLLMAGTNMGQSKEYEFDRVFGPQEGQEQVNVGGRGECRCWVKMQGTACFCPCT